MFLDGFIYRLRDYGVPVSVQDTLDLYEGMEKGLAPDLPSLFVFARLCCVRKVEHMDAYERAFAFHFYGLDLPRVAEGAPELFHTKQFREWLEQQIRRGELPPHAAWTLTPEELMKRFWDTVREQMEAHHGGGRWIGTKGNSPFGHSGNASGGVRVHGESKNRSALKVIGERRYVGYADDATLKGENLGQALATLKNLKPHGPVDQLDLDETIYRSARNGGEIELAFTRDLKDKLEVLLLIDNGGSSMRPWANLTRTLFSKARNRFKKLDAYYFHNTIYGSVFEDARRTEPVPLPKLLEKKPDTRILIVGDASMAPSELFQPFGAIDYEADDREPSIQWLERLRDRFPHVVWLNPIPKEDWPHAYGRLTIREIGKVLPMEDLTLGGVKRAVERLS